jgi:hypothetical protein
MKKILDFNKFLGKMNENASYQLFNNESKLKNELLKSSYFSKGEVLYGITGVLYVEYKKIRQWDYSEFLDWINKEYGTIPYFTTLLSNYNGQVCNGGHLQYFDNGHASKNTHGFGSEHKEIYLHEEFVGLFFDLGFNKTLKHGKEAFDIIESFDLDLQEETEQCSECDGNGYIDCSDCDGTGHIQCEICNGSGEEDDKECSECGGDGSIVCEECHGTGEQKCSDCNGSGYVETGYKVPDSSNWSILDDRWYNIYEEFMESYNDYLKSLTLDGQKISDLVKYAKSIQNYNL